MIKIILSFLAFFAIIFAAIFYQNSNIPTAIIKNHNFKLLIAKNENDKQIGLSKYNTLDQDKAMLFVFEKSDYYRFWMKDMKFPIDIIFIKDNKIVKIYKDSPILKVPINNLPIYSPPEPINRVLEINAGISQKFGFEIGDSVQINNLK